LAHPSITLARHVSIHPSRREKALATPERFADDGKHVIILHTGRQLLPAGRACYHRGVFYGGGEAKAHHDTWKAIVAHILLSTEAVGIKAVVLERRASEG
jgi:hypothetical protein